MPKLLLTLVAVLLGLFGCSEGDSPSRPNDFTPLTSIEIVSPQSSIANLTSTPFTAIGNFSGLFTRDVTAQVLWASSVPAVAAISNAADTIGRATAASPGTTSITASLDGIDASFELLVTNAVINSLTIAPIDPSTPRGLTTRFSAVGTFSDATTQDLTFDAVWESSNPTVAAIGNAPGNKGQASALASGISTISAAFGGLTQTTVMTVTDPALQSISIAPASASQLSLTRRQYSATGTFTDGTSADISTQVNWTSSNPLVAEINGTSGQVTTLAQGASTLRAELGGVAATSSLTVTGGDLVSIQLSPLNPDMVHPTATAAGALRTSRRMTAMGSFSNGRQRDITEMVTWGLLPAGAAEVSNDSGNRGLVRTLAASADPVTLSATFRTITASTSLSVLSRTLASLQVTPLNAEVAVGTSTRFAVTGSFAAGPTQDLTLDAVWTASGTAAGVDNSSFKEGRLRGVQAGVSTVTASYGGQAADAALTVTSRSLQSLNLTPATPSTAIGGSLQLTATAVYTDGTLRNVTEDVDWSLSNTNVAIFADASKHPGLLYGVNVGTTTVSARLGSAPAQSFTLNVLQ